MSSTKVEKAVIKYLKTKSGESLRSLDISLDLDLDDEEVDQALRAMESRREVHSRQDGKHTVWVLGPSPALVAAAAQAAAAEQAAAASQSAARAAARVTVPAADPVRTISAPPAASIRQPASTVPDDEEQAVRPCKKSSPIAWVALVTGLVCGGGAWFLATSHTAAATTALEERFEARLTQASERSISAMSKADSAMRQLHQLRDSLAAGNREPVAARTRPTPRRRRR